MQGKNANPRLRNFDYNLCPLMFMRHKLSAVILGTIAPRHPPIKDQEDGVFRFSILSNSISQHPDHIRYRPSVYISRFSLAPNSFR